MRISMRNLVGAFLTAALLAACGGGNNGLNSLTPNAPQIGAPGAMKHGVGIAVPESAAATGTVVHRIVPASSYHVLYSFRGRHGADPLASLINVNGTLYGTTFRGGTNGWGTIFSVTTTGTEKVLHSFGSGSDGKGPYASLINVNGTLYGTTSGGGVTGTVFSVTTTGKEKVLYSFGGGSDGISPEGSLINVNGTLYGTTAYGGAADYGTVFSVTVTGTEEVLHGFGITDYDGANPYTGLITVKGTLYGTTYYGGSGGSGCGSGGCGTVFSVTTSGTEKVARAFGGGSNGFGPYANLVNVKGTLYGTTFYGGANGDGTVFSITTDGMEKVLHSFGGPDGKNPEAGLIEVNGKLYVTTEYGGHSGCGSYGGCGTIFSVTTSGTEKVLHSFGSAGSDGEEPYAGLITVKGRLYGTTEYGGAYRSGTVFALAS
jgi:uncharacterized repeat protein (TIGR03803 family)